MFCHGVRFQPYLYMFEKDKGSESAVLSFFVKTNDWEFGLSWYSVYNSVTYYRLGGAIRLIGWVIFLRLKLFLFDYKYE